MSNIQQPGWWQAADGNWYPPETPRPQPEGAGVGGLVSLVGWAMVLGGVAVVIATIIQVQDASEFNDSVNFGDYLIAMSPGFIVVAAGAAAAGVGHVVTLLKR